MKGKSALLSPRQFSQSKTQAGDSWHTTADHSDTRYSIRHTRSRALHKRRHHPRRMEH